MRDEENIGDGEKPIKRGKLSSLYKPSLTLLVIMYESWLDNPVSFSAELSRDSSRPIYDYDSYVTRFIWPIWVPLWLIPDS